VNAIAPATAELELDPPRTKPAPKAEPEPALEPLTPAEQKQLAKCEAAIKEGADQFVKVAGALWEIYEHKLWRSKHHPTFRAYCERRWHFSTRWAYVMIEGWEIRLKLEAENDSVKHASHDSDPRNTTDSDGASANPPPEPVLPEPVLPKPGRQTQALAKVPEANRGTVWGRAVADTNGNPTAEAVEKAAAQLAHKRNGNGKHHPAKAKAKPAKVQEAAKAKWEATKKAAAPITASLVAYDEWQSKAAARWQRDFGARAWRAYSAHIFGILREVREWWEGRLG
jgi:hypothetical protein